RGAPIRFGCTSRSAVPPPCSAIRSTASPAPTLGSGVSPNGWAGKRSMLPCSASSTRSRAKAFIFGASRRATSWLRFARFARDLRALAHESRIAHAHRRERREADEDGKPERGESHENHGGGRGELADLPETPQLLLERPLGDAESAGNGNQRTGQRRGRVE